MAAGLVTTSWIGTAAVGTWGVLGIAAASAAGITVTALLLLRGISGRGVPVHVREVVAELSRPMRAALVAGAVGWFCAGRVESPVHGLAIGSALVTVVFVLLARALGVAGLTTALGSFTRGLPHAGGR
jgi:putative peptidoglycan lipid II flippase